MKKILGMLTVIAITFTTIFVTGTVNAESIQPEYDGTFNNNKGILYANGTDITIKKENTQTIVTWDKGNITVPETVTIVGGGKAGTNFEKSNIIMEDGTVSVIYGGGISLEENKISKVKKSNIIINNGTILETLYGGGLIYSTIDDSNIKINGGTIKAICGGGCASAVISSVAYAAGTETDLENSKNRVQNTDIEINGGKIDSTPSNFGMIFGGGQGYSYVKDTKTTINDGDLSKAYITAGGSNGYTENGNITIKNGNINTLQTVNRGILKNAKVKIEGGTIENAYVGGEDAADVTGTVDKIEFAVINGRTQNLKAGKSAGSPLVIDHEKHKVITAPETVKNSEIGEQEIKITYDFEIEENQIIILKKQKQQINVKLTTNPTGYEYLFDKDEVRWICEDENIANVNQDGEVTGVNVGNTIVKTNFLNNDKTINVKVIINPILILMAILVSVILVVLVIFLFIFNI